MTDKELIEEAKRRYLADESGNKIKHTSSAWGREYKSNVELAKWAIYELRLKKSVTLSGLNRETGGSGYFDEIEKKLVVAGKKNIWLGVLVHEYAHLTQWVDGCKEWIEGCEGLPKVDEWLAGKRVHNIQKHLARSRDLELDNEKRSVKLIKKYKLPIDIKSYVQRANAYVQFYNWMFYTRKWSSEKNSPYCNPNVYEQMPTTFRMNYKTMSDKYKQIYKQNKI